MSGQQPENICFYEKRVLGPLIIDLNPKLFQIYTIVGQPQPPLVGSLTNNIMVNYYIYCI